MLLSRKLLLTCCLIPAAANAQEGMWLPRQAPQIADRLKSAGLAPSGCLPKWAPPADAAAQSFKRAFDTGLFQ